jgi:hypothetical protein
VAAIQNAFKWAEATVSLSKMYGRGPMLSICGDIDISATELQNPCCSIKAIVDTPVELVLRLLLESPVEHTQLDGGKVFHEGFKCACASLGPDRTAALIAQILMPKFCRSIYLSQYRLLEDETDLNNVNHQLSFLLLQSLHAKCIRQGDSTTSTTTTTSSTTTTQLSMERALEAIKDTVSKDKTSLQQFCACLVFSKNDIYLYMKEGIIEGEERLRELVELARSEVLWRVVLTVAESDILFLLDSISPDVIVRMCCISPALKTIIEVQLLLVGEESIRQLAQGIYGKLICFVELWNCFYHVLLKFVK